MDSFQLAEKYPALFHVSKASWQTLLSSGLRSTSALVSDCQSETNEVLVSRDEGFSYSTESTESILSAHRPNDWLVKHPSDATIQVKLRNQRPLSTRRLVTLLTDGMEPQQWIRLLNSYVFLFPEDPTKKPFVAYEKGEQTVLVLDTKKLLQSVGNHFWNRWSFSEINLGATIHDAKERGRSSIKEPCVHNAAKSIKEVLVNSEIPRHAVISSLKEVFKIRDGDGKSGISSSLLKTYLDPFKTLQI